MSHAGPPMINPAIPSAAALALALRQARGVCEKA